MTQPHAAACARECRNFCRYLAGRVPDEYVVGKYLEAHHVAPDYSVGTPFDGLLVNLAAAGPIPASFVDSYACLFARRSLLRKKLILLLAILESCSPQRGFLDAIEPTSRFVLSLRLLVRGLAFLVRLLISAIFLFPLRVVLGGTQPQGE